MNHSLDQILNRPRPQKIGILAAAMVLLLALGFFYVYQPSADQISRLNEENDKVRQDRDKKQKTASNLTALRQDLREWDAKLKMSIAQLPDSR